MTDVISREGGAVIKTINEGIVAAFTDPVGAVRAGLELQAALASSDLTRQLKLRIGIHRGPAMVATVNDHLDYFGTTARIASELPRHAGAGEVVLTEPVAADPEVANYLRSQQASTKVRELEVSGVVR